MSNILTEGVLDTVCEAAIEACQPGEEIKEEELKYPSVALKIGHDIKRMASIKRSDGIMQKIESEKRLH